MNKFRSFHPVLGKDLLIECGSKKEVDPESLANTGWRYLAQNSDGTLLFTLVVDDFMEMAKNIYFEIVRYKGQMTQPPSLEEAQFIDRVLDALMEDTKVEIKEG